MTTPILICDDSAVARKQMARSLPEDWDVEVHYANNGAEALDVIRNHNTEILFLDLTMPVMDGYEVLKFISVEDLHTLTIVVSGDVQPEAHRRVKALGAMDFIQKPIDKAKITAILHKFGILDGSHSTQLEFSLDANLLDCYRELSNVAMGQAADLLARLLNVFVILPIPNLNVLEVGELHMAIQSIEDKEEISALCQGFIGPGIVGEALLIFNDSSFSDMAQLMKYSGELDDSLELELLMDVGNILIGAFLNGLAAQLDIHFSQGHPMVLGQHCNIANLIQNNINRWQRTLAVEIGYSIENYNINCDLMLLFTEDSLKTLNQKVLYLMD